MYPSTRELVGSSGRTKKFKVRVSPVGKLTGSSKVLVMTESETDPSKSFKEIGGLDLVGKLCVETSVASMKQ